MVISSLLLKIATRCNIACRYCYWFRDPKVYSIPKVLTLKAEQAFMTKLQKHIEQYNLKRFSICFHGGEPLLFGKNRFKNLCESLLQLAQITECEIPLSLTSNALLLDQEWIDLLLKFKVYITLSIDGDPVSHDENRIDIKGDGTYQRVENKLKLLQKNGINPPVLMVANPFKSAKLAITHLVDQLGIKYFNVLIPDLTHEDRVESIANYYIEMFDLWFEQYVHKNVQIPIIDAMMKVCFGGQSPTQMVGLNKVSTVTMLTDGSLQATDDIRAAEGVMSETITIQTHELQDIINDPLWKEVYYYSDHLHTKCLSCEFKKSCGGSTVVSRWSDKNRFNNPSIYCHDMQNIFTHIKQRLYDYSPKLKSHLTEIS